MAISVTNDLGWAALCSALDRDDWAGWAEPERRDHHDEIDATIAAWTSQFSVEQIVQTVTDIGVPVGEVVLGHLVPQLEQILDRGFFEEVEHAKLA